MLSKLDTQQHFTAVDIDSANKVLRNEQEIKSDGSTSLLSGDSSSPSSTIANMRHAEQATNTIEKASKQDRAAEAMKMSVPGIDNNKDSVKENDNNHEEVKKDIEENQLETKEKQKNDPPTPSEEDNSFKLEDWMKK